MNSVFKCKNDFTFVLYVVELFTDIFHKCFLEVTDSFIWCPVTVTSTADVQ